MARRQSYLLLLLRNTQSVRLAQRGRPLSDVVVDLVVRRSIMGEKLTQLVLHPTCLAGWHHPARHWHRDGAQRGDAAQVVLLCGLHRAGGARVRK